jgi:oxygen-independent coproporphyrinogen-3 oxidase
VLLDEVGFGLTAFSSLRDRFVLNTQNFDEYYAKIDSGSLPVNRGMVRSQDEIIRWATVLPLKNRTVRKRDFTRITGLKFEDVFRPKVARLIDAGLAIETDRNFALTELGRFFADEVVQQFFAPMHLPFRPDQYAPGPLHPLNENDPFAHAVLEAAE